jgi:hypothetical protein
MTMVREIRTGWTARSGWGSAKRLVSTPGWSPARGAMGTELDRLLLRAVLGVAVLLAVVVVAGTVRRALDLPAIAPGAAVGLLWLAGCAAVLGWLAVVAAGAYRDRARAR